MLITNSVRQFESALSRNMKDTTKEFYIKHMDNQ